MSRARLQPVEVTALRLTLFANIVGLTTREVGYTQSSAGRGIEALESADPISWGLESGTQIRGSLSLPP